MNAYTQSAFTHIRSLSETIGGRGSCTPAECQAAEYAAEKMRTLGVQNVRLEAYRGAPSTYRPYALAFTAALLGTLGVWLINGWAALVTAAVLSALGAWGMLAETDFSSNWMRALLPKGESQNAIGIIPPGEEVKHRLVLCAHLDTHRTPIFYSSRTWNAIFGMLVAGAFVSMAIGTLAFALGAAFGWEWVRWIGLATAAIQVFALVMSLQADFTSFSPGANDNASGVGLVLSLAERLIEQPLVHTEAWLAFTGCEEAGAYGMSAFLDAHAAQLGDDAVYIILDQVGKGELIYLTADGLILKRATHPHALALARSAAARVPAVQVHERVGIAYTDAAVATKRGLIALTLCALPPAGSGDTVHWHQLSDTVDKLDARALADAHTFAWQVMQEIERQEFPLTTPL